MNEWFCHYLINVHLISFYFVIQAHKQLVCLCLEECGVCAPDEAGFNEAGL